MRIVRKALHQGIDNRVAVKLWRALPIRFRRRIFNTFLNAFAPRAGPVDVPPNSPIVVAGSLTSSSGLGQAARLCLETLENAGLDVYGVDLSAHFKHDQSQKHLNWRDGRTIDGPATLLLHVNAPMVPYASMAFEPRWLRGMRVVGCWVWETSAIPKDWSVGFPRVHEIWSPSHFAASAIAARTAESVPIHVVPHPIEELPAPTAPKNDRFTVLSMFNVASNFERKNPLAAIRVFVRAFAGDPSVKFVVKIMNSHVYRKGVDKLKREIRNAANIELRDGVADRDEIHRLIQEADVVLSTHRSEGFGLVMAEAMQYGKAVVATGWSGNMDFMTRENSCPIGYRLVPVVDPQMNFTESGQHWAEIDQDEAASTLRRLRDDPGLRREIGKKAYADIRRFGNRDAYVARVSGLLGNC